MRQQDGERVRVSFVLSVPRYDGNGLLKGTDWVSIRVYGNLAETCFEWLDEGKECLVEGCLKLIHREDDTWQTIVEAENMQLLIKKA